MKTRMSFFIVLLLMLPLVLAACSNEKKIENAQKFLEALAADDVDEARTYLCEEEQKELDAGGNPFSGLSVTDIECADDGGDVKCTFKVEGQEIEFIIGFEGDKVCYVEE